MVEEITPEELHERTQNGDDVQVVDIRAPRNYRSGHIPGAVNIPFDRFASDVDRVEWGHEIVVACPIGQSSQQAARLLEAYEGVPDGARVMNLTGGYAAWEYELERDE